MYRGIIMTRKQIFGCGNDFTPVYLVKAGMGQPPGGQPAGGHLPLMGGGFAGVGVCIRGSAQLQKYKSGQYTFFWNAFLFSKYCFNFCP